MGTAVVEFSANFWIHIDVREIVGRELTISRRWLSALQLGSRLTLMLGRSQVDKFLVPGQIDVSVRLCNRN